VPDLAPAAVGFARLLRAAGLDIPVGNTIAFAEALAAVGIERRDSVYWAGQATLVRRPEDIETYDRAFAAWWERTTTISFGVPPTQELTLAFDADDEDEADGAGDDEGADTPMISVRYSPARWTPRSSGARTPPARGPPRARAPAGPGVAEATRPRRPESGTPRA
jgi:uncharacterized protein with von Willebrand factor type A (vWA) domain